MSVEFDSYAREYSHLLQDPIRDQFAIDGLFFHRRKWELLQTVLRDRKFPSSNAHWVDVGCGKGELLSLGAPFFARAVGCDPSRKMIRAASVEVHHQQDPAQLPFADESFDLLTIVCVYHHVQEVDQPALTGELYRVLRPGGLLCVIEHNPYNPITRLIVNRTPIDADAVLLSPSQSSRLVRRAGFVDSEVRFFLYLPEKLHARFPRFEDALSSLPLGGQYALLCTRPGAVRDRSL